MNYALFGEWVRDRVEDLVRFGVPRDEAEQLVAYVERGAIAAEARERSDHQFLLDFKRVGSAGMAERLGVSQSAVNTRRRKLLKSRVPFAATLAG
jgi:hypothetical protein